MAGACDPASRRRSGAVQRACAERVSRPRAESTGAAGGSTGGPGRIMSGAPVQARKGADKTRRSVTVVGQHSRASHPKRWQTWNRGYCWLWTGHITRHWPVPSVLHQKLTGEFYPIFQNFSIFFLIYSATRPAMRWRLLFELFPVVGMRCHGAISRQFSSNIEVIFILR